MFGTFIAPLIKRGSRDLGFFLSCKTNKWFGIGVQFLSFNSITSTEVCAKKNFEKSRENVATNKSLFVLNSAVCQIPHHSKRDKGGEDTYFISSNKRVVGVFDGVGGWNLSGVDPRDYALKISSGCKKAVDQLKYTNPLDILQYSYKKSLNVLGSCTACIVSLVNDDEVSTLNLGDSGFLIIRPPGSVIYRSIELQHSFNMPYQLGINSGDRPTNSHLESFSVQPLDFILLATDGVFDNLENERIVDLMQLYIENLGLGDLSLQNLAETIAQEALKVSLDPKASTPFAKNAARNGYFYTGGKPDDITVLISQVVREEKAL